MIGLIMSKYCAFPKPYDFKCNHASHATVKAMEWVERAISTIIYKVCLLVYNNDSDEP
jgi:hypothetical protein